MEIDTTADLIWYFQSAMAENHSIYIDNVHTSIEHFTYDMGSQGIKPEMMSYLFPVVWLKRTNQIIELCGVYDGEIIVNTIKMLPSEDTPLYGFHTRIDVARSDKVSMPPIKIKDATLKKE